MSSFCGPGVAHVRSASARCALAAALLCIIYGCATAPPGNVAADARELVADRTGADLAPAAADHESAERIASANADLTREPLTADNAVRLAILNNHRLREQLAGLGVADADRVQAGLIANPTLFASVRFPDQGGARNNVEFGLSQDVLDLLMRPARTRVAGAEFERTRAGILHSVIGLVLEVREKYFDGVGAAQIAALKMQVANVERLSGELAARFAAAGNISASQRAAAAATSLEAEIDARRAEVVVLRAKEELQRLIAVPAGPGAWTLPDELPWPATADPDPGWLEDQAIARRLDLAAARSNVAVLEESLGMARRWRWTGGIIAVGVSTETDADGIRVTGPQVSIGLPLFDQQQARIARLESRLQEGQERQAALESEIRGEMRDAHAHLLSTRALVDDYRQRLVPAREGIVSQLQLEQNYMLIGVFDVLAARQQELATREAMIESLRDYWSARMQIERGAGGGTGVLPALAMSVHSPESAEEVPDFGEHTGHQHGGDAHGH